MTKRLIAVLGLALLAPLGAQALEAEPACTALDASLPEALATWTTRSPLLAATGVDEANAAAVSLDRAVDATLHPTSQVAYAATPAKPGTDASYGGLLGLTVNRPGIYRIVLSAPAWVDVVRGGAALTSTAHQHGPACSTARKMVDFTLAGGRHVVQIVGSPAAVVGVLVTREAQ